MDIAKHKILEDVEGVKCFYIHNGAVVRNIYELADALDHMTQTSYEYHANPERNDFSNWLQHVLGDKELAGIIQHKSRTENG